MAFQQRAKSARVSDPRSSDQFTIGLRRDTHSLQETLECPSAEAFRPLIRAKAAEGDKAGLSASGLLGAYGLLS